MFTTTGNTSVDGSTKQIHRIGVVGQVQFVPVSDGLRTYTGCFDGVRYGLLRLSSAIRPSESIPFIPGLGLKFLRDGCDSANVVTMQSLEGQPGNWNFFAHSFTTTLNHDVPLDIGTELVTDMAAYD